MYGLSAMTPVWVLNRGSWTQGEICILVNGRIGRSSGETDDIISPALEYKDEVKWKGEQGKSDENDQDDSRYELGDILEGSCQQFGLLVPLAMRSDGFIHTNIHHRDTAEGWNSQCFVASVKKEVTAERERVCPGL